MAGGAQLPVMPQHVKSVSPSGFKPPRQKAATKPKGKAKKDMSGRQEATVDDAEAELGLALGTYGKVFKSNAFTESMALRAEVITGLGGKLAGTLHKLGRGKEDFGETDHRLNLLKAMDAEVIDGDEEMGFELRRCFLGRKRLGDMERWEAKAPALRPRVCVAAPPPQQDQWRVGHPAEVLEWVSPAEQHGRSVSLL